MMKWLRKKNIITLLILLIFCNSSIAASNNAEDGYVANNENINGVFNALSSVMKKPVVISKAALRKKVSGEFNLTKPFSVINSVANQIGLIYYNDGQAVYIYDSSEIKNTVIVLKNTSVSVVLNFLRKSKLYDDRYPLRTDSRNSTFYVSGPPIYIDVVRNTALFLDQKSDVFGGGENIAVIPLFNVFVEDREYKFRNKTIVIPGMTNVINNLMSGRISRGGSIQREIKNTDDGMLLSTPPEGIETRIEKIDTKVKANPLVTGMSIISDPGSNSILVRGSAEQVDYVRNLVASLDIPKRHIELSVWIVDLQKEAFDNLGVEWGGSFNTGSFGLSLNGMTSTVDGANFMATAVALSEKNKANIVSRPMVLTQENIPAIFDNNRTFYSALVGERTAELESITYGTLVSVLPRFTEKDEVEMMLNIEDGNQVDNEKNSASNDLPEVGRTLISTVARVPKGKSLLVGGYTRDEQTNVEGKIPLLGDIPWVGGLFRYSRDRQSNMVRVFLIQPREIYKPLAEDANKIADNIKKEAMKTDSDLPNWMMNHVDSQKWQ